MRFLIYGAGALGQALGCMLAKGGHEVDLLLRKRFIDAITEDGLKVQGFFGDIFARFRPDQLHAKIDDAHGDYDYVLLTTKAYDTGTAIKDIDKLSGSPGTIVSMQNGCGNVEMLGQAFGKKRVMGARIITGFEILSPGLVHISVSADDLHVGSCQRGVIGDKEATLAKSFNEAGHPCTAVKDIYKSLFSKLLYNCTLNPLGAILGVNYGLLSEQAETRQIMDMVIEETFAVIKAMGGKTDWPDADAYKKVLYEKLLPITYHHRPSMLQDLENNKPTEIDALTGYVSEQGRGLNVATPVCDLLTSLVKFKEGYR